MERDDSPPTVVETPRRRGPGIGGEGPQVTVKQRYELGETLGRGGMGEVVAARDLVLGRDVAIKRMLDVTPSDEKSSRFLREARIQGALDHPAIPPVHELARDEHGLPFFVMKRLAGTTLANILQTLEAGDEAMRARYPRQRLLRAFADACLAIELAHTRGIVHRDLKPSNVMLGEFGEVFVLDWGVAKVTGEADPWLGTLGSDTPSRDATQAGTIIGTPGYMAPEQRAGGEIDGRTDVFALGCLLHDILTCKRRSGDAGRGPLRPSAVAQDIPPELDDLCAKATTLEADARLSTARALGEGVQRYLDGDRDLALRRRLASEHLAGGLAAAARDGEHDRRTAMREAGRALALDPTLEGAAELVGRMMLEPPRTLPAEVSATIEAEQARATARLARVGAIAYLAYVLFIPYVLWLGLREPMFVVALLALLAVLSVSAYLGVARPPSPVRYVINLIGNATLIAIMGRMFTPFLIAPGLAAVTALLLTTSPILRRPGWLGLSVVALVIGFLVPWLLEVVGAVSPTFSFTADAMQLHSNAVDLNPWLIQAGLVSYACGLIAVAALVGRALGRGEEAAQRQLYVQAWQLRQLLPA